MADQFFLSFVQLAGWPIFAFFAKAGIREAQPSTDCCSEGEARARGGAGTTGMEQLSEVCLRGSWRDADQRMGGARGEIDGNAHESLIPTFAKNAKAGHL
jgi:hypothetical protein